MEHSFLSVAVSVGGLVGQPGSIGDMVTQSGPVVRAVLYLLLVASVLSWAIIFYKLYQVWIARRRSQRFATLFWATKNLSAAHTASLEMQTSPVVQVFLAGYRELRRLIPNRDRFDTADPAVSKEGGVEIVELEMRRVMREEITGLEYALTFLATTASSAPFVGLFGTVWGIVNAFRALTATGSSSVQAVAPGIAEALIATAVGLAVAIPAVVAYNYFSRQVQLLAADMESLCIAFLTIAKRDVIQERVSASHGG